jgi:hypothetical protein
MFIGHLALGFGAKRLAPRTPLGLLLMAPFLPDLIFPILLLLGWEQIRLLPAESGPLGMELVSLPYSHSLMGIAGQAVLVALAWFVWHRDGRGAVVLAGLVLSHWGLDVLTHRPDMAVLLSGAPRVGLGLWHSPGGTVAVEGVLFALCVWLYASATRATDGTGRIALGALIGLLVVMYLGFMFGPPMPGPQAVAYVMLAGWLIPFWGLWIERHRTLKVPVMASSGFDSAPT